MNVKQMAAMWQQRKTAPQPIISQKPVAMQKNPQKKIDLPSFLNQKKQAQTGNNEVKQKQVPQVTQKDNNLLGGSNEVKDKLIPQVTQKDNNNLGGSNEVKQKSVQQVTQKDQLGSKKQDFKPTEPILPSKPLEINSVPKQIKQEEKINMKSLKNKFQKMIHPIIFSAYQSGFQVSNKKSKQEKKALNDLENSSNGISRSQPNSYEVETDLESKISFQQKRMMAEKMLLNSRFGLPVKPQHQQQNVNLDSSKDQKPSQVDKPQSQGTTIADRGLKVQIKEQTYHYEQQNNEQQSHKDVSSQLLVQTQKEQQGQKPLILINGTENNLNLDTRRARGGRKKINDDFDDL